MRASSAVRCCRRLPACGVSAGQHAGMHHGSRSDASCCTAQQRRLHAPVAAPAALPAWRRARGGGCLRRVARSPAPPRRCVLIHASRSATSTVVAPPARVVAGAAALVAGTTVGAGILALPAETAAAGFAAAAPALVAAWAYSAATGLFLAEVSLSAAAETRAADGDAPPASLLSLARRSLGGGGAAAAGAAYLFLHYALLVAYTVRGAEVLSHALDAPPAAAAAGFTLALGAVCAFASPDALDAANGALLAALLAAFAALLGAAAPGVHADALARADFAALPPALPVLALAFVHHNVVPRVAAACGGHAPSVRAALLAGTFLPLLMFISWEAVALGALPPDAPPGADPLTLLAAPGAVDAFSLLAVATSYIGFVLGLSDFFTDGLAAAPRLPPPLRAALPLAATLLPPLAAAVTYPGAFFNALEVAGVYGVLSLFGILPPAMALSERARARDAGALPQPQLVPGGDAAAVSVAVAAAALIAADAAGVLGRHS